MAATTQAGAFGGRGNLRFTWRGAAILQQIDAAVQAAMDETAAAAKAHARSLARVDTGEMRDGIDATVESRGGSGRRTLVLAGSAPHTLFNELGTSRMSAQPMLRPAMDAEAPKLTQRLRAAVGKVR